jgi:hypothetical protein
VPGPLDIDPLPHPSTAAGPELAEGWTAWWQAIVALPKPSPHAPAGRGVADAFAPPDFPGLAAWPTLREVVARRWPQAHDWHSRRKDVGLATMALPGPNNSRIVAEVARRLGRPVPPFSLDLIVLPVRDDEVRRVHETRYLVPERVYDGPGWADRLRPLVTALSS